MKIAIRESLELFHRYNPGTALWRGAESVCFAKAELIHPVLDIGCGDGAFGALALNLKKIMLGESTKIDTGIDIQIGNFHNHEAYQQILESDVMSMPFPDEHFMTVISNCVMEHIADIGSALKEIYRVLKKGGKFYFTVPSEYFNQYFICPRFFSKMAMTGVADYLTKRRNRKLEHYNIYPVDVWRQILERNGLRLMKHRYIIPRKMQRIVFFIFGFYNVGIGWLHIGDFIRACELLTYKLIRTRPFTLLFSKLFQALFTEEHIGVMRAGGCLFIVAEKERK